MIYIGRYWLVWMNHYVFSLRNPGELVKCQMTGEEQRALCLQRGKEGSSRKLQTSQSNINTEKMNAAHRDWNAFKYIEYYLKLVGIWKSQFGFFKNKSCQLNLTPFLNQTKLIYYGNAIDIIFIDFYKHLSK